MIQKIFDEMAANAGKPRSIIAVVIVLAIALVFASAMLDAINLTISIASLVLSLMILGKQDRDATDAAVREKALQAKLDELISCSEARNELIDLEDKDEAEIARLKPSGG